MANEEQVKGEIAFKASLWIAWIVLISAGIGVPIWLGYECLKNHQKNTVDFIAIALLAYIISYCGRTIILYPPWKIFKKDKI